jgi:hypothetical protein
VWLAWSQAYPYQALFHRIYDALCRLPVATGDTRVPARGTPMRC